MKLIVCGLLLVGLLALADRGEAVPVAQNDGEPMMVMMVEEDPRMMQVQPQVLEDVAAVYDQPEMEMGEMAREKRHHRGYGGYGGYGGGYGGYRGGYGGYGGYRGGYGGYGGYRRGGYGGYGRGGFH